LITFISFLSKALIFKSMHGFFYRKTSLGYVCNHVKVLDKTSNYWNLTHMTPGEIGTIVLRIALRLPKFQPNLSWRLESAIRVLVS